MQKPTKDDTKLRFQSQEELAEMLDDLCKLGLVKRRTERDGTVTFWSAAEGEPS